MASATRCFGRSLLLNIESKTILSCKGSCRESWRYRLLMPKSIVMRSSSSRNVIDGGSGLAFGRKLENRRLRSSKAVSPFLLTDLMIDFAVSDGMFSDCPIALRLTPSRYKAKQRKR